MKILITGGTGYLGGRLAQYLESNEYFDVYLATRNNSRIVSCFKKSSIKLLNWDSDEELESVCSSIDVILHLAALNANECVSNTLDAVKVNVLNTARLLKAASKQGVKKFIYFSTAHVYSNKLEGIISESTPTQSIHPYASTHKAAEDLVRWTNSNKIMECLVIRISNSFGPPIHKDVNCWMLLINDLCNKSISTKEMFLKSPSSTRRDFITITDVCRAVEHLIQYDFSSFSHDVINVGGNWAPTILEMAKIIQQRCRKLFGFSPAIHLLEANDLNPNNILVYNTELLCSTGFRLRSDINDEIDKLLVFCNSNPLN